MGSQKSLIHRIENHSALCELLGWERILGTRNIITYNLNNDKNINTFAPEDIMFDSDRALLSKVVDKICKIDDQRFNVIQTAEKCVIFDDKDKLDLFEYTGDRYTSTYMACIDFAKWYNTSNSILLHYDINLTVNDDQAADVEAAFEEGSYTGEYQYDDDGVMSISFDKLDDLVKFSEELRNRGYAV